MASRTPAKTLLDLNDDVLYLVCELVDEYYRWACSLSPAYNLPPRRLLSVGLTCKRLHSIASPLIYAKLTHTDESKTISHRPSISRLMSVLENSEVYAHCVRNINIDKHVFPERDVNKLVALSPQLKKLDTLRPAINKGGDQVIAAFRDTTVPGVKTLAICAGLEDLAASFPNLKAFKIEDRHHSGLRLWVGRSDLTQLRHLELEGPPEEWTPELFSQLATYLPQLHHLGVVHVNNLATGTNVSLSHAAGFRILSPFSELRSTKIADLKWLGPAWLKVNQCCLNDKSGYTFLVLCELHAKETMLWIARLVFEACESLEKVCFDGDGVVVCTRKEDGEVGEMVYRAGAKLRSPFDRMETLKK